jgi:hypothetical protein
LAKDSQTAVAPKRRRTLRVELEIRLPAFISGSRSGPAEVQDLALGGAFLLTKLQLEVGDMLHVKIPTGDLPFQSAAKVRAVSRAGVGVEFVQMKPEDHALLRDLIAKLLAP